MPPYLKFTNHEDAINVTDEFRNVVETLFIEQEKGDLTRVALRQLQDLLIELGVIDADQVNLIEQ